MWRMSSYLETEYETKEGDYSECPICDRKDKPEDFIMCEDCGNMVCESCYDYDDEVCEECATEIFVERAKQ